MSKIKKAISLFVLLVVFILPCVLAGCKSHVHACATADYSIEGTGEDIKVYKTAICNCGNVSKKQVAEKDIIVVKPYNAQEILDSNFNGKVLVFDGEFNDVLEIRPTRETADVRTSDGLSGDVLDLDNVELNSTTAYYYTRCINDVVFIATTGSRFNNMLVCESGEIGRNMNGSPLATDRYDAVKNQVASELGFDIREVCYYSRMFLNNIQFTNLNFYGKMSSLCVEGALKSAKNNHKQNIVVSNCKFTTSGDDYKIAAIHFSQTGDAGKIVVKNNKVDGYYQGFYTSSSRDVEIYDNEIKNTIHNAIGIQDGGKGATTGKVLIKNNSISNTTNRAIRFGLVESGSIIIEGNTFVNCAEDNTSTGEGVQLLKTGTLTKCTFRFVNNTYGGETMADVIGGNSSYIIYVIEPTSVE